MKKKSLALLMAMVMAFGAVAGGTLAWLQSKTGTVENTFTIGKVEIALTETVNGEKKEAAVGQTIGNAYKLIPGETYVKDPKVTVKADSEPCYLYVEFENHKVADEYIQYKFDTTGWNVFDPDTVGGKDVYYREAVAGDSFNLLKDNKITINPTTVTAETMAEAATAKLSWKAYAIQKDNVASAAEGWKLINAK